MLEHNYIVNLFKVNSNQNINVFSKILEFLYIYEVSLSLFFKKFLVDQT